MNGSLLRKIYRKKEIENIEASIKMLGERTNMDAITFMSIRYFTTLILFVVIIFTSDLGYLYAPLVSVVYYYLFHYVLLKKLIQNRARDLDHQALYFFEILTLTLESGRNLENSLEITVCNVDSELSNEFKKALLETKFGKTLIDGVRKDYNIILSSRDIVKMYPDVTYHFFIDATLEQRTNRKYMQYNKEISKEQIREMIQTRDELQEKSGYYKIYPQTKIIDVTDCKSAEESAELLLENMKETITNGI